MELLALKDSDFDPALTGLENDELGRLMEYEETASGLTDEDAVPELQEQLVSAAGGLWIL